MTSTEHRLTKLETRLDYTERMADERRMTLSAHSRRLRDVEGRIHGLTDVQMRNIERIVRVEERSGRTAQEMRDMRLRRQARVALVQWAVTVLMAGSLVAGYINSETADGLSAVLGGLALRP